MLTLYPWPLKKYHWVIWEGGLFAYQEPRHRLKDKVKGRLRASVIRRIGHLVVYIPGDVELARKWYGAKGTHHECIMYLSNVIYPKTVIKINPNLDKTELNILLSNSADPNNNHTEALEHLLPCKIQKIKIYTPLFNGDQSHAKKRNQSGARVVRGQACVHDRFHFI